MASSKQISINLIGEEEMGHTPVGRIVTWAVTYGRYIMIGTEIVVLLAFISRFSLDRKLTDLKEEVSQKEAIIEANVDFEKDFRKIQDQLSKIQTLLSVPAVPAEALNTIQSILPSDVRLDALEISNNKLTALAVAGTTDGFSQFIAGLQATPLFQQIDIGDIRRSALGGIQFQFTATLAQAPKKK